MRKKQIFKKGLACLLSTAMVVTGISISPGGMETVEAAIADTIPTPLYLYDFESGLGSTGSEKNADASVVGAGAIVSDEKKDGNVLTETYREGKVFNNAVGTVAELRKNYLSLPSEVGNKISNVTSKTITVAMWIKSPSANKDVAAYGFHSPLFAMKQKAGTTKCDPLVNVALKGSSQVNYNGWVDNNVNTSIDYVGDHMWHYVAATFSENGTTVYIDGIMTNHKDNTQANTCMGMFGTSDIFDTVSIGGNNIWTWEDPDSHLYFDDVAIYDEELSAAQIYYLTTGEEPLDTDKNELSSAINAAKVIRTELYTDESATLFSQKLTAANSIYADAKAKQDAIDAATTALTGAQKALAKKHIDLEDGLVLNSDMTSEIGAEKITVGGYDITPLGDSTIETGYIQSSTTGEGGKAGISLDVEVLKDASLEKGLTFNILWNFSKATTSDWQDLISILDSNDKYLMRNTLGFITWAGKDNVVPGTDCKNGYNPSSCQGYKTGEVKNLAITIDTTGIRMYVDGVLACEKTDMTAFDFDNVFAKAASIVIGQATEYPVDGDMQGQLHGLQVYHRALNAAEVDELATNGVSAKTVTAQVKANANTEVVVTKGDVTVQKVITDANGNAVIKGLVNGTEYSCTITNADGTKVTAKLTAGTDTPVEVKAPLTGIAFEKPEIALENKKIGDNITPITTTEPLKIVYTPANTTDDKGVTYESSDDTKATVDEDGYVTAKADASGGDPVTVTITATSKANNEKTATCTVTITTKVEDNAVLAESISIDKPTETVEVGKDFQLTATILPTDATVKDCGWESSNPDIAKVDPTGKVTGVAVGEATITAKTTDGTNKSATCSVKVIIAVESITLDKTVETLKVDNTLALAPTVAPETATDKAVSWKSSDETIATVDANGTVTGVKDGKADITATAGGKSATCTVYVRSTNTAGALDNTEGWATPSNAGLESLTGDFDVTYKFVIDKVGVENWFNYVIEMKAGTDDFLDIRADGFAFTNGTNFGASFGDNPTSVLVSRWEGAPTDWAEWKTSCVGATVEANLVRTGDTFSYTATFSFGTEMKATFSFGEVDVPDDVQLTLLGDHASFSDIVFTNNTNTSETHSLTKVDAKPATCTEKGNVEYYHCSICEKNFSDDKAATPIDSVETEAIGHSYGADTTYADASGSPLTKEQVDALKCNEKAYVSGTCTRPKCGYVSTGEEIIGTNHTYGTPVVTKATPDKEGGIIETCSVCDATVSGHEKKTVIEKPSKITLDKTSYEYTGKDIEPKVVKVEDSAGNKIDAANYTVSYSNNKDAGTNAKVKVTFKEDSARYSGNLETTFTITKKQDDPKPDDGDKKPDDGDKKPGDDTGDKTPAASLTLDKATVTLYTGKVSKTVTIKPTVTGASKTVTWKTDKPKVATVKNGKITAVGKGTATITATANGISKTVKVTVKNPTLTIKKGSKKFTKSKLTVKKKQKAVLTVTVSPKNSGISIAKLTAKQKKIASVTLKKGKITIKGKKKGSFTLQIKSGKTTKKIKLTVK